MSKVILLSVTYSASPKCWVLDGGITKQSKNIKQKKRHQQLASVDECWIEQMWNICNWMHQRVWRALLSACAAGSWWHLWIFQQVPRMVSLMMLREKVSALFSFSRCENLHQFQELSKKYSSESWFSWSYNQTRVFMMHQKVKNFHSKLCPQQCNFSSTFFVSHLLCYHGKVESDRFIKILG